MSPSQKKALFRNKRDDLYFKAVARDVRKYILDDFNRFKFQAQDPSKDLADDSGILRIYVNERILPIVGNYEH